MRRRAAVEVRRRRRAVWLAAVSLPSWTRSKSEMERVRVWPGMLPPSMRTTPNSPTVWVKVRRAEVRRERWLRGRMRVRKMRQGVAPRPAAASVRRGSKEEAGEAEGEGVAEEAGEEAAGGGERSEADEEVEAEDGGREDEREGDEGLDECAGDAVAAREPPGEGDGEEEQEEGGGGGELEGED